MSLSLALYGDSFFNLKPLGVARCARELQRNITAFRPDLRVNVYGTWTDMPGEVLQRWCRETDARVLEGGRNNWIFRWSVTGRPYLERVVDDFDLVHFFHPSYPVPTRRPVVATVHDIAPLQDYRKYGFPFNALYPITFSMSLRDMRLRGAYLSCSSYFTADQIRNLFGYDSSRMQVIPLGVNGTFVPASEARQSELRQRLGLDRPYILAPSSFALRKNHRRVIRAFAGLLDELEQDLVLYGPKGPDEEDFAWGKRQTLEGRIRYLGFVDDKDLPVLYTAADLFVFAGLFEGFGFPALEAMACGTPVVSSDSTSLPELVGEAGVLADPFDVTSIGTAISKLARDANLRSELSAKSLEQAKKFSWERTSTLTLQLYQEALARG